MRFSAIAVSAAIFGVAMALPNQVVYETEVVTITSCAPDKTNCPGRVHSSTVVPTSIYTPPVVIPTSTATPIPTTSAIPIPSSSYVSYPNGTTSASASYSQPPVVSLPSPVISSTVEAIASVPAPTYAWVPSASASIPSAPANTSTPVVPTAPPSFEGAASIKGFSFAAVAMAAAAFVLA